MFKVNNEDFETNISDLIVSFEHITSWEICSKLIIEAPERRQLAIQRQFHSNNFVKSIRQKVVNSNNFVKSIL